MAQSLRPCAAALAAVWLGGCAAANSNLPKMGEERWCRATCAIGRAIQPRMEAACGTAVTGAVVVELGGASEEPRWWQGKPVCQQCPGLTVAGSEAFTGNDFGMVISLRPERGGYKFNAIYGRLWDFGLSVIGCGNFAGSAEVKGETVEVKLQPQYGSE